MNHIHSVEVLLDGRALTIGRPTLAEALRVGVSAAHGLNRIVIEVKGDGKRIPDDLLAQPSDELTTIKRIELVSANPRELVGRSLREASSALDELRDTQQTAAQAMQAGDGPAAYDQLGTIFSSWQAVREVVVRAGAVLGTDVMNLPLTVDGEPDTVAAATADLSVHLRAIKDAMASEDVSAMGDILAYDLDAAAARWSRVLTSLADALGGTSP
ncbi:MAG: hypothetical protein WC718_10355 [Phycisphaerales bacterium]|jgi:hypothetical protein